MKNRTIRVLASALMLVSICIYSFESRAQGDQSAISVNLASNSTTKAWLHLPDDYNSTATKYPLLIFIHGVGEAGTDINKVLAHGVPRIIAKGAKMQFTVGGKLFKFIVVSPQIPNGWASETMVQNIMDDIKSRYRVDNSRVYLTGLSAGGYGVLNYVASGTKYSDNLAAIVPVSEAAIDDAKVNGLCNVASSNIAVWSLCGASDAFISNQEAYVKKINSCNPAVKAISTSYAGGGHNDGVWDKAYDAAHTYQQPNIYEWMLQYKRADVTSPPPATAPVAAVAQSKITITLPASSVTLDGSSSTAPNSSISSYAWTRVSGATTAVIGDSKAAKTTVTKLAAGSYVFRLTVTNAAGLTSTADVNVTVLAASTSNSGGAATTACSGCKFLIKPGSDGGAYINGDNLKAQPGDTICVQAGNYTYIQFYNFTGSSTKPLVFINCGGQVKVGNGGNYGLIFNNVKYFKVTGSGSSDKYGFRIDGVTKKLSSGLAMGKGCTDYEADRIEITGSEVGTMAKVNPDCETTNQYPYFAIRNVKLHDLYIHDVTGEGMYIGNTAPNGTQVTCSGVVKTVLPPRIYNLKIYNVITQNTGWDGIQVASAPENVEIYNNSVSNFGTTNMGSQQAGIILGGESNGKVYNNKVVKGTGNGIEIFGTGLCYVYNNIISDAGFDGTSEGQDALFVDDRPTKNNYTPLRVYLFNNTVVNSKRDGIRFLNSYGTVGTGNLIYNNLVVNAGSVARRGAAGYIGVQAGINYLASNNVYNADINAVKFVDAANKDFHLAAGSPAIDQGKDLSAYFKTDIDGDSRPYGAAFDAGADEYKGTGTTNKAPVASAGSDVTITLPVSTVTLDGSASTDPDGTIASYKWTQPNGPVAVTIASPTAAKTGVSKLTTAGVYVFQLTVTDNKGATATDQVTVTVKAAANITPTASAGSDQTITLPTTTAVLNGTGTDTDGTIASYKWTQVSGPVTAIINTPTSGQTGIRNLTTAGSYVFQLTVTDNKGAAATEKVTITVKAAAANIAPTANAGSDQTITLPTNVAVLNGTGTDTDGTIASYKWTQVSGPVTAIINTPTSGQTGIRNLTTAGNYVFQLTVTDNKGATGTDNVTIIVKAAAAANLAPTANAGADQTITQPKNTTYVTGAASSDPDGTIASYKWTQVSGPTTASIVTPNSAGTDLNRLTDVGQYVFQLTVTDNKGATATDKITVTVKASPANTLTANAGSNQTITLPYNMATLNGSASSATNGEITGYTWRLLSGPSGVTILNSAVVQPVATFTQAGQYTFQLTVTDNYNNKATATVVITVNSNDGHSSLLSTLNLYPNPVSANLNLVLNQSKASPITVRLYDSYGNLKGTYYLGVITYIQKVFNVGNLPGGSYVMLISDGGMLQVSRKFVKID